MKLLLDTHIFLWFLAGDASLSKDFRDAIEDVNNKSFLSAASVWEVVIKCQAGKLLLPSNPETYLPQERDANGIESLPIEEADFEHLAALPPLHRDPFDRVILAQAVRHDLKILTVDKAIRAYGLQLYASP
jgi:PIN domain nuclease of toxin-antitoxin system